MRCRSQFKRAKPKPEVKYLRKRRRAYRPLRRRIGRLVAPDWAGPDNIRGRGRA